MPNSKPVSESGCGSKDYDRAQATLPLMKELSVGQKSGEENGWLSLEEIGENIGIHDK